MRALAYLGLKDLSRINTFMKQMHNVRAKVHAASGSVCCKTEHIYNT